MVMDWYVRLVKPTLLQSVRSMEMSSPKVIDCE